MVRWMQTRGFYRAAAGEPNRTALLLPDGGGVAAGELLAASRRARSVDFVAALPRDPNEKLYERRLRDPYSEGREQRI